MFQGKFDAIQATSVVSSTTPISQRQPPLRVEPAVEARTSRRSISDSEASTRCENASYRLFRRLEHRGAILGAVACVRPAMRRGSNGDVAEARTRDRRRLTGVRSYIPRAMRAYAEWLWIDSKFSASTLHAAKRASAASRPATPRTRSSTKRGLSYARSVTYFSSARLRIP